jgi:prepilin-type N-terminal cleavage/methylation domain-containing protein
VIRVSKTGRKHNERARRQRLGFTLLEILLAMGIGLLLLAGLYVAVGMQVRHAQIARELVEESTLARAILDRMASDIRQNLGPTLPAVLSSSGSSGGSSAGGGGGSSGGSGSSSGGTTGGSGSTSSTSSTASQTATTTSGVVLNVGVQGDSTKLILCTSQVPRPSADPTSQPTSDLRRIAYWLANGLGLSRKEIQQVTSDDANSDLSDDPSLVIAGEVVDLTFSYFDGSAWQDNWDGTTLGPDGQTPIGPPVAVGIDLTISSPDKQSTKKYHRVVLIPTANGVAQQNTTTQ